MLRNFLYRDKCASSPTCVAPHTRTAPRSIAFAHFLGRPARLLHFFGKTRLPTTRRKQYRRVFLCVWEKRKEIGQTGQIKFLSLFLNRAHVFEFVVQILSGFQRLRWDPSLRTSLCEVYRGQYTLWPMSHQANQERCFRCSALDTCCAYLRNSWKEPLWGLLCKCARLTVPSTNSCSYKYPSIPSARQPTAVPFAILISLHPEDPATLRHGETKDFIGNLLRDIRWFTLSEKCVWLFVQILASEKPPLLKFTEHYLRIPALTWLRRIEF